MDSDLHKNTNFCIFCNEIKNLIDAVNDDLLISMQEWKEVLDKHLAKFPKLKRVAKCLKQKFYNIKRKSGPTGNPKCLPYMQHAKEVHAWTISLVDGSTGSNNGKVSDAVDVDGMKEESNIEVMFNDGRK